MDEIAHVEELLPQFIDSDRTVDLDPEAWLPHLAQAALLEWDMSASALQADFQRENAGTLAGIATQLRSANVPVCTTMVIDDIIYWKLFQPEAFLERPENAYQERGYLESFRRGEEKHQRRCGHHSTAAGGDGCRPVVPSGEGGRVDGVTASNRAGESIGKYNQPP